MLNLLRHGETDANAAGRSHGLTCDHHLNATGLAQAAIVGRKLKHIRFDAIYTSTRIRAVEMAEAINIWLDYPVEPIIEPLLIGRDLGSLTGKLFHELTAEQLQAVNTPDNKYGVETTEHFRQRISVFLKNPELKDHNSLIISHGHTILEMLKMFDEEKIRMSGIRRNSNSNTIVMPKNCDIVNVEY